jgi:inner membrane protein
MLHWPFIKIRYIWNIISVVDPLFLLPLILFVIMAAVRNNPYFARIGVVWALCYLGVGW